MAHTATNVLIHFIFSTRQRAPMITSEIEADLHSYLGGIVREIGGVALCINGIADHVHLLVRMPSTHSSADVIRLVKANSSRWVHERWPQFKNFAWQAGYGAFSVSESAAEPVRQYILQQRQHHSKRSFQEEFVVLLKRNHITVDESTSGPEPLTPLWGFQSYPNSNPRLAPWALLLRRFAASQHRRSHPIPQPGSYLLGVKTPRVKGKAGPP